MKFKLILGDITKIKADAIVNAANSSLLGGGGVDGAIHRAGGAEILEACQAIRARQGKCKAGQAVITTAGNLPATHVIHTVGPIWNGGTKKEPETLANCYSNSVELCVTHEIRTVAFPCISTGIYRFPPALAAEIAVQTLQSLGDHPFPEEAAFVCFDQANYDLYSALLK